jgi:hypothetical protein
MAAKRELEYLRKHCNTDRQTEILDGLIQGASHRELGRKLGISQGTIGNIMTRLNSRAAMAGEGAHFQAHESLPNPLTLKGTSTLYKDGVQVQQWVKTTVDGDQREAMVQAWIDMLTEGFTARAPLVSPPAEAEGDLLAVYPMGDPHFGLLSWAKETGEDFDLQIAEARTFAAVDRLVSATPNASEALFVNLGDMFHADDESAQTPASGHSLDVDSRHSKVLDVASRAMVHCILRLLEKHAKVTVWNVRGNHDPSSSMALAAILRAWFRSEPRVSIPYNPSLFSYYRFGSCLIGATHGHGPKMPDLPLLMAADRSTDWGATEHRHWLVGHIHHKHAKEYPGCMVESFNSLTGSDAWHHGKGYRARKNMHALVFHAKHGEWQRHICGLSALEAA